MDYPKFDDVISKMPGYLRELESCQIIRMETRQERRSLGSKLPTANAGIYVLYEDEKPIYVGRSDRLKERLLEHGQPSGWSESATFAFILAKEKFGKDAASMSRRELQETPRFKCLFTAEKARIREMGVRVVAIKDPIEQTIFEVYAHLALKTPYNSFEVH